MGNKSSIASSSSPSTTSSPPSASLFQRPPNQRLYTDPWSDSEVEAIDTDVHYLGLLGLRPPQHCSTHPTLQQSLTKTLTTPPAYNLRNSLHYTLPLFAPSSSSVLAYVWATRFLPPAPPPSQYSTIIRFSPTSAQSTANLPFFQSPMFDWVSNPIDAEGVESFCSSDISRDMTWAPREGMWHFTKGPKDISNAEITFKADTPSVLAPPKSYFPRESPLQFDGVDYSMTFAPDHLRDCETTSVLPGSKFHIESMVQSFNILYHALNVKTTTATRFGTRPNEFTIHASMPLLNLQQPNPTLIHLPEATIYNTQVPLYTFLIDATSVADVQLLWRWFDCFRVLTMQNCAVLKLDTPLLIILCNAVSNLDKVVVTERQILEECERLGLFEVHFFSPSCPDFGAIPSSPLSCTIISNDANPNRLDTFRSFLHWSMEAAQLFTIIDRLLATHIYSNHIQGKSHQDQMNNPCFPIYHWNRGVQVPDRLFPLHNYAPFPQHMSPLQRDVRGRYIVPLQGDYVPMKALCGSCPQLPDGTLKPTSTKHTSLSTILSSVFPDQQISAMLPHRSFGTLNNWAMASGPPPFKTAKFFRGKLTFRHAKIKLLRLQLGQEGMSKFTLFPTQNQHPLWNPANGLLRHFIPPSNLDSLPPDQQPVLPVPKRIHANISFVRMDRFGAVGSSFNYTQLRPLFLHLHGLASIIFPIPLLQLSEKHTVAGTPVGFSSIFQVISAHFAIFDFLGFQTCPVFFVFIDDLPVDQGYYDAHLKHARGMVWPPGYPLESAESCVNSLIKFLSRIHPTPWTDHRLIDALHINVAFTKPENLQETLIDVQRFALHEHAMHFHKVTWDELVAARVDPKNIKFSTPIENEPPFAPQVDANEDEDIEEPDQTAGFESDALPLSPPEDGAQI